MSAPDILAEIKDDLGVIGSDDDEWLQRRIDAIWRRMEVYTDRALCAPPQQFVDDWGLIAVTQPVYVLPPVIATRVVGSVFLRYFPVVSIDALEWNNGETVTPGDVHFDPNNGKLFSVRRSVYAEDLSVVLRAQGAAITYTAGWAEVPADLYEIVLGAISPLYRARKSSGGGGTIGNVTGITVQDVGSIEVSEANLFVSSAAKGAGASDPLLGPYANMLDQYIDWRSRIGNAGQPVTTPVAVPP